MVEAYINGNFKYRAARVGLLDQDNSLNYTGDLLYNVLKEIEEPRQWRLPYSLTKQEMEANLFPEINQSLNELSTQIQSVWKFYEQKLVLQVSATERYERPLSAVR